MSSETVGHAQQEEVPPQPRRSPVHGDPVTC
jgi:hypothetical protein